MKDQPQAVNPYNREEWRKAIEHHSKRIKSLLPEKLFGYTIGKNHDAIIVAAFLLGTAEGRKHAEEWLENYKKEQGLTK